MRYPEFESLKERRSLKVKELGTNNGSVLYVVNDKKRERAS
jgi:hypothetical protein